jgi:thiol-disulfide isomerase/thioredoxin
LVSRDPQTLLEAQALDLAGKPDRSYKVLVNAMAEQPSDALRKALAGYGSKIKKSPAQIEADIRAAMVSRSGKIKDFALNTFRDAKKVKLSDYRGRVVLLDFWHQGSVTARDDFPYLQKMLEKYEPKGLTVVTVNIQPTEPIAAVLMSRYRFVSLQAPDNYWFGNTYRIGDLPAYLLLDRQGRVLFRPQFGSYDSQQAFELEVEILLASG